MNTDNVILATDSYKLGHWRQYPKGTEGVYSYLEAREGATHPETVFFGLQPLLRRLRGVVVTQQDIEEAAKLSAIHFGDPDLFNREGWEFIVNECGGKLPVRIKAVPEGTVVPVGNVLMTVENTRPEAFWLTNALESYLLHVWYPITVATLSRGVKQFLSAALERTGSPQDGLPFMLHDFGYRGAATHDAAAIAVAGHLVNFVGADSLPAMILAINEYAADPETLAFSVPATEHSIMTSLGREGEPEIVDSLLDSHPAGILSVVADSYDIYEFVRKLGSEFKDRVLARGGVFVVRPDSVTPQDPTPPLLVARLLEMLWDDFGGTKNAKGFRVLDPHVRVLWGDGIDPLGIEKIVNRAQLQGFAAENLVFGMGGGLLQKVNRDTERFAFKSSAQKRNGEWHDVSKKPLGSTKASKAGRLALVWDNAAGQYTTVREDEAKNNALMTVFEDGELFDTTTFEQVRARAAL